MEFSITEQQVPMLLRLAALIMALQTKQFPIIKEKSLISAEERDDSIQGSASFYSIQNKIIYRIILSYNILSYNIVDDTDHVIGTATDSTGWGGWAWNMMSSLLPIEWDNDWSTEQQMAYSGHTIHLGIYVQDATLTFKVTLRYLFRIN